MSDYTNYAYDVVYRNVINMNDIVKTTIFKNVIVLETSEWTIHFSNTHGDGATYHFEAEDPKTNENCLIELRYEGETHDTIQFTYIDLDWEKKVNVIYRNI